MSNDIKLIEQHEIKFFIDPSKVLSETYELEEDIINLFQISNKPNLREILFIDTANQDMYKAGWILRNRKKTNKYELTYKKRYKINDNDINSALSELQNDFKEIDNEYKIELEWGYTNKSLSMSLERNKDILNDLTTYPPSIEELQKMFIENAPEQFINWKENKNWGIGQISNSKAYCPIHSIEYTGIWNYIDIDIDIWSRKINNNIDIIAEISFKATDENIASQQYSKLKDFLSGKNLLVPKDLSKTQWALTCCNK
ncbi:hypothetical protein [Clostridium beijerinckii]|uniref:CYTH domain-containing protein n=1 Tax=Clostridium beijerinckii TaxID=1520 RepID=A0AAX0AYN6_CLOBE|nr:hypothetical protein [Clostridium beijerinckii]NRT87279.1 hypothetical protein [Clostridium beijerinckii]NYC72710.1 hypothetical protein [Clostridium beijerinckii]